MARLKENEFRSKVKQQLATRVAYRCSNPGCRKSTIGPKTYSHDAVSIGKAAHICAASEGGPRYDINMTSEQISGFDNGIWLCAICADEIDLNWQNYPKESLKIWKGQAEKSAGDEKGNKLPSKADAVDTLVIAMGGNKKQIPSMIENVHKASSQVFEQLDPRFTVKSSYINQQEHFEFSAKENVSINIKMRPKNPHEFAQNYFKWAKYGEDLDIDASEINVEGSNLFKEMFNQNGRLKIGAPQKDALIKIWTILPDGKEEHFDDLPGRISLGSQGFKFSGHSVSKLLKISINKTNFENSAGQISINLNLAKWNDVDVTKLAYFDKFKNFFDCLSRGGEFFVALEIEGNRLISTKKMSVKDNEYFQYISCYLVYTNAARVLAGNTNQLTRFKSNYEFSAQQYADLLELQRVAEGKAVITKEDLKSDITFECCFESEAAIDAFEKNIEPATLKFVEVNGLCISVFGQIINLPPKVIIYHSVGLRLIGKRRKFLVNQKVKLKLVPLEHFHISTLFDKVI